MQKTFAALRGIRKAWIYRMRISKRRTALFLFDSVCFASATAICYLMSELTAAFVSVDVRGVLIEASVLYCSTFIMRGIFKVYNGIWRYASTWSYFRMTVADMIGCIASLFISKFIGETLGIWFFVTTACLNSLAALFSRVCYRLLYKKNREMQSREAGAPAKKNIAIIGAGQLGAYLAGWLNSNSESEYTPVCFIDTDSVKAGRTVAGLPVYSRENAEIAINKYGIKEVVIAIAYLASEKLGEIKNNYERLGCRVKLYETPIHEERGNDSEKGRIIRDFSIEDLLFRSQRDILGEKTASFYKDKVVMVTGGGGSIGSELCRCIAKCSPKKLIIFDIYENNAYEIEQELIRKYGDTLKLETVIGSVRDVKRLECVFASHSPEIVFHAAAHKHVPLMEHSPAEAIKNNVMGTYNVANVAERFGVKKFILISTDKAVNPTNIMGASKRLCEMVIQCRQDSETSFSAVRFGNVLGSNGSVIPLFKRQIAAGGPVTITDKRIIRYFMTISEASQLVMTAGAMAKRGELFVLDMGKPVRIYDLAVSMIKMSGSRPGEDIEIQEVGLRPGEKLFEELLMKTEKLDKTTHELIFIERENPVTRADVEEKISDLMSAVYSYEYEGDADAIHSAIKRNVPTFKEPDEVNKTAEQSDEMKDLAKA